MSTLANRARGVFAAILISLAPSAAWGQGQSISLSGIVTDPSGSVVPHVKINLVNFETGETWRALSNGGGAYTISLVKPGRYDLTAEAPGFKQHHQTGIVLETGVPARADIRLEIGEVTMKVTVADTIPLLRTETAAVGVVVDNRTIANMPLVDRRAAQLARLAGAVVQTAQTLPGPGNPAFVVAGGRGGNTLWMIDGGIAQFVALGAPGLLIDPPIESLREFNVSVSNLAAELGRTGGGAVQMTTRSGTNQFHGSAYEYFRNDALDARSFFDLGKPAYRYNLYGASFSGPIQKNKAHFFFNYEGLRRRTPLNRTLNVPDPAEIRGDFSRSTITIRDPGMPGTPAFPGNVIPASRLDPVGLKLAAFYPEPNVPGRPSGNANFRQNHSTVMSSENFVGRVDYNLRDRDRVYGRLLAWTSRRHTLPVFPASGMDPFESFGESTRFNASATWLHDFARAFINEFRFTYNPATGETRSGGAGLGIAELIGLRGTNPRFPPTVNLAPLQNLGFGGGFRDVARTSQLADNVTYIQGSHGIKFGFEWRPGAVENLSRQQAGGNLVFSSVPVGSSLAALLLGWVNSASRNESLPFRYHSLTVSAFVQDDWKVHPRLTLNLGLRWDWDQPRWEEYGNRQSSFDRLVINPVSGTPGIVTFAGRHGQSKFAHKHDWNNFGPRVGFAWRVTDDWVIRGGGAVLFSGEYAAGYGVGATLGFSLQGNFTSPDLGVTPAFLLRNGLPTIVAPAESDLTPGFGAVRVGDPAATMVSFFEPDRRMPYLETFNLNLQRRLAGNLLVELGYLGTLGHKLAPVDGLQINQVPPHLVGPGNLQVRRPFPQFSNITVINPAIGNSNYHGMNLKLEKRASRGLHFLANYTWSRSIDDINALAELGSSGSGSSFSNTYNRRGDRGLSGNHISHRFIWSSVYELPFGQGNSLWSRFLGGWSTGLIAELRTGAPYGVTELGGLPGIGFAASLRPNVVGDPRISGERARGERLARWFDSAAFAAPPQFTFGNAGATSGYGPGAIEMDLSILKDFRMAERHSLQFRTEMINFINHANFILLPQNLQRGNPMFGQINNSANLGRVIQFGLHYRF